MAGKQNSISAYHSKVKGEHANAQNAIVLQCMRDIGQATNIRMIHRIINARGFEIDLVSLRRCITNLSKPDPKGRWLNQWGRQVIRVEFDKECPITKITVGWYSVIDSQIPLFVQQPQTAAA